MNNFRCPVATMVNDDVLLRPRRTRRDQYPRHSLANRAGLLYTITPLAWMLVKRIIRRHKENDLNNSQLIHLNIVNSFECLIAMNGSVLSSPIRVFFGYFLFNRFFFSKVRFPSNKDSKYRHCWANWDLNSARLITKKGWSKNRANTCSVANYIYADKLEGQS